jgi:hypothetical protein
MRNSDASLILLERWDLMLSEEKKDACVRLLRPQLPTFLACTGMQIGSDPSSHPDPEISLSPLNPRISTSLERRPSRNPIRRPVTRKMQEFLYDLGTADSADGTDH